MAWVKVGDVWEKTESVITTKEEADLYYEKESAKTRQRLFKRLVKAELTSADAPMLRQVAHMLEQGISLATLEANCDALVSELPNVPKPVEEGEIGEVEPK